MGDVQFEETCMKYINNYIIEQIEFFFRNKSKDILTEILKQECNNFQSALKN